VQVSDEGTTLEEYEFLGASATVRRSHPQPGVDFSAVKLAAEPTGDAGDPYTGLDRFGRLVDSRWVNGSGADLDRFRYGYDRAGNRLYRENVVDPTRSELYAHDALDRLTSFQRGTLNVAKDGLTGAASRSQSWDFDALGNWDSVTTDTATQTRTANRRNEITSVSGATTPTHDLNGNLTVDEAGRQLKYDAWNRLVEVRDSGSNLLASFRYDGLGRRVRETRGGVTTDLYSSAAAQVVEERVGGVVQSQYVWSPGYVDALVERDRDTDANGSLDERLYAAHDASFNVTAVFDTSGSVVERYAYDPFGARSVLTPAFGPRASSLYQWDRGHQGLELETEIGLYANRERWLSPTLGRFTSTDPLGFGGGDANLYGYVGNGPTGGLDPSGLADVWGSIREFGHGAISGFWNESGLRSPLPGFAGAFLNGFTGGKHSGLVDSELAFVDHLHDQWDRLLDGDFNGMSAADTAFMGGLALRSDFLNCKLPAAFVVKWVEPLDPEAFHRGYRHGPAFDLKAAIASLLIPIPGPRGIGGVPTASRSFAAESLARAEAVSDAEVINAIRSVPTHYGQTYRSLLTPAEQAEFEALRAAHPEWMPSRGLDTPATMRTVAENAKARAQVN